MDPDNIIHIKVINQDGDETFFRTRCNTSLSKVLRAYCMRKRIDYQTVRFLHNGNKVNARRTPQSIGMIDGDEIEAFFNQMGGGRVSF